MAEGQARTPILVDDLAAAPAEGLLLLRSSGLTDECFTFVTTETGAQGAQEDRHEDRVAGARARGASRGIGQRLAG